MAAAHGSSACQQCMSESLAVCDGCFYAQVQTMWKLRLCIGVIVFSSVVVAVMGICLNKSSPDSTVMSIAGPAWDQCPLIN